tara:strand:- start:34 stop:900 length:867 start_codon:yes stop_codon:yes gene_type:complete
MNLEMFKKTVDEYSVDGGGTVSFTPVVGDPLMDKKLIEKVKYARSKKNIKSAFMYTNGLFLDNYDFKELVLCGFTRIAISIHFGSRELYKKYFGVDGYERVLKNIKNLARTNIEFNRPLKITLHMRVEAPKEKWLNNEDFKEISELLDEKDISYKTHYENWSGYISEKDLPSGCTLGDNPEEKIKHKVPCWELYRKTYVMSDGDVGTCTSRDMEGEIDIGSVEDGTLMQLWRGDKLKKFRSNWKKGILPKVCQTCDRYRSIDNYVKEHKFSVLKTLVFKRIFKLQNLS